MAMRHPRLIVFCGAISALSLMTVLSVVFGMAATIIPKIYTYYISTALFAIFGLKMIYEGYFMKATDAQEELEEVQSSLRKREDELRSKCNKRCDDADAKRKNSNSDKEDGDVGVAERSAGAGTVVATNAMAPALKNPEMTHRQRKQPNNNYNNNNNGCEQVKTNDDNDDSDACNESDVFLDGVGENLKMSTFHSSPALSASVLSNQTDQTICDEFTNSPNKINHNNNNSYKASNNVDTHRQTDRHYNKLTDSSTAIVHSTSASAALMGNGGNNVGKLTGTSSINSINSLSSLNSSSAVTAAGGGQPNGELKQLGGNKKRLERDVSATLVQDPESGLMRKNSKKSATYLTTRVLMQAFTMTFLAEWGDRSQLTTIILAASKNVYGVIAGGIIGHSICTGLAVIGGRMIATKISVRTVTILGGIVFLGFALYALLVRPDDI